MLLLPRTPEVRALREIFQPVKTPRLVDKSWRSTGLNRKEEL